MKFGIVELSIIPVRKEPSDRSEMSNQLLFGDLIIVEKEQGSWWFIRSISDNYEGWVDFKQILIIDKSEFDRLQQSKVELVTELIEVVTEIEGARPFPVLLGSTLRGNENGKFRIGAKSYYIEGDLATPTAKGFPESLFENALMFLNAPYLWGGKSVFGMDCSGFTQVLFRLCGADLLRDANQQATMGELISLFAEAKPGDLLFFDNSEGKIVHVGVLMEDQKIIHASGRVRIDRVDHQGNYNEDLKKYSHQLRLIRRIL